MLAESVSSTPKRISSGTGAHLAEEDAGGRDAESTENDLPFALEFIRQRGREQRTEGRRDGDDEGVTQAAGDGDAAADEERRNPVGEAVETDRLKRLKTIIMIVRRR